MNKLIDGKELAGDSAVDEGIFDANQIPESATDLTGLSSAFGTDLISVNVKKGMTQSLELKEDGNLDKKTPDSEEKLNEAPLEAPRNEEEITGMETSSDNSENTDIDASKPANNQESPHVDGEKPVKENQEKKEEKEEPASEHEENSSDGEETEEEDNENDYSNYTKQQLFNELQSLLNNKEAVAINRQVNAIKSSYNDLVEEAQKETKDKPGDGETGIRPKKDNLDSRFEALLNRYKARKQNLSADLEKQKELNLQKKHEILETLRQLIDAEETNTSISALKKIQQEWKSVGPIPHQFNRSLWASYNALIDRFYDNRSIYFELKELDRKKNLEGKIEICEKAEKLTQNTNLKEAIKELNELHEEFKHIGPVPREQQEVIWQRFKAASDQIYSRRKEYLHDLKKNLQENLEEKKKLVEEVEKFTAFDSESIVEWNNKTREILEIQKKWESTGAMPKEHTKTVNKSFWSAFKSFFSNKNKFFKKLESKREENLQRKEELVVKADALKESDNWEETASQLKELQMEWKNIGPVPEKMKDDVFNRFKKACDEFFERRRQHGKVVESEYSENLKKKEEICTEMENMIGDKSFDINKFQELQATFEQIGYVPRNSIKKIQKRFNAITEKFLDEANVSDEEKNEIKFSAEINKIRSGPDSNRRLQRKETEIRKLINKLENDIAIWKNNLDFFKESDTAEKLKAEFNEKIDKASTQLSELKEELKMIIKY